MRVGTFDQVNIAAATSTRRRGSFGLAALLLVGACSASTETADPPSPVEPVAPDATTVDVADAGSATAATSLIDDDWYGMGFLDFPVKWSDDESMDSGFSMYVAAWPYQQTYPGPAYQSGLPSSWLVSTRLDEVESENYSTIEGGLGWWNDTRFATEAPKFIMGGVSSNFLEWANGPGAGAGTADVDRRDWETPQGKYGVAQLSPYVLWAPDGLNIAEDSNGGLFGYGYQPLPIIDMQTSSPNPANGTDVDIETGDRSWTLFLSTGNFSGPVSFFIPNFFSKPALDEPSLEGIFFDSSPMIPQRGVAMETQVIPAAQATDTDGTSYARINQMQFPASDDASSIILNQVASYSPESVWEPSREWFDGGAVPDGAFVGADTRFSEFDEVDARDTSTYTLAFDEMPEAEEYPIDFAAIATVDASDPLTFRYRWNLDLVERAGEQFLFPQYFRLDESVDGNVWTPVPEADLPPSVELSSHEFSELGVRNDSEPYTTPDEPGSIWQTPGPVSETFRAELGDGSVVTYEWYRFIDQPAIQYWGFSDEQLGEMQARVEEIHRAWGPDETYLAPPSVGELVDLDPAIVVTPPAGLEVGYVPIVTRQELAPG